MKVLDIFGLQIQNPYYFFYWINSAIFRLQLATTEKILVESVEGGVYGSGGRVGGGGKGTTSTVMGTDPLRRLARRGRVKGKEIKQYLYMWHDFSCFKIRSTWSILHPPC